MSSPPYDKNPHFVDHDFETSDTLWQSLSLPIDSFNCQWPFFQESNISSHAADYTKISGELDSNLLVGEELSALSMSSLNNEEISNYPWPSFVGELDPTMLLEQEIFSLANDGELIEITVLNDCQNNSISLPSSKDDLKSCEMDSCAVLEQENNNTSLDKSNKEKGVIKKKEIKHRFKRLLSQKIMVQPNNAEEEEEEEEGSTSKKQKHNAKEKIRRMELNASYLALGSLLPNSRRSKKRWTAPVIIDKVLEYIPQLQSEIEELTLKKNSIVSKIKSKQAIQQNASVQLQPPTVSVHEVKQGELIIQICMQTNQDKGISILMKNLEAEGMVISTASSNGVCDDIICYHVHVQMNGNPLAADYLALRKKILSLLKTDS